MDEPGGVRDVSGEEVLAIFRRSDESPVPLTTTEVIEAVDKPQKAVLDALESLAETGELRSKLAGEDGRVWWLQSRRRTANDEETVPSGEYALELEFRSEGIGRLLREVAVDHTSDEFEISIDGDVPLPDGRRIQYYTASGVSVKKYIGMLDEFDSILRVRLLSVAGDSCRVEVELAYDSMGATFAELDGRTKAGFYRRGTHYVVGELPADVDVDAAIATVHSIYPQMEHHSTRRIVTSRQFYRVAEHALTERQFTVLQLAFYGGYFEQPRLSTGADLAAQLGITKQTFNTHLRKAYQALFEQLFHEAESIDTD